MRWPGRFALKLLGLMLLVALLSAAVSTYAFYFVALRFADFSVAQADHVAAASKHAAEMFRTYFENRNAEFQRRAQAIAQNGVQEAADLAATEGLLRARLLDGDEQVDLWEAAPETLADSREAPPVVVALPTDGDDASPRILELTFGIPFEMYENSLSLREAIEKEKELGHVYEHVVPHFLRQYVVLVLMLLAAAPLAAFGV